MLNNKQKTTNQYQNSSSSKIRVMNLQRHRVIRHHHTTKRKEDPQPEIRQRNRRCAIFDEVFGASTTPWCPSGIGRIQFLLIFVSFCYDFYAERTASARSTSWPVWRHCFWTRRRRSLWSGARCWGSKELAIFLSRERDDDIFELQLFISLNCFRFFERANSNRNTQTHTRKLIFYTCTRTPTHIHTQTQIEQGREIG